MFHVVPFEQSCIKRHIPFLLGLEHDEEARNDESRAANDLRQPKDAVHSWGGERIVDGWDAGDACNPKDGRAHELEQGGEEADLLDIMRPELVKRWPPRPSNCQPFACKNISGVN